MFCEEVVEKGYDEFTSNSFFIIGKKEFSFLIVRKDDSWSFVF